MTLANIENLHPRTNYLTPEGVVAVTQGAALPKKVVGRIGHNQTAQLFEDDYWLLRAKDDKIVNLTPTLLSLAIAHATVGIGSGVLKFGG